MATMVKIKKPYVPAPGNSIVDALGRQYKEATFDIPQRGECRVVGEDSRRLIFSYTDGFIYKIHPFEWNPKFENKILRFTSRKDLWAEDVKFDNPDDEYARDIRHMPTSLVLDMVRALTEKYDMVHLELLREVAEYLPTFEPLQDIVKWNEDD